MLPKLHRLQTQRRLGTTRAPHGRPCAYGIARRLVAGSSGRRRVAGTAAFEAARPRVQPRGPRSGVMMAYRRLYNTRASTSRKGSGQKREHEQVAAKKCGENAQRTRRLRDLAAPHGGASGCWVNAEDQRWCLGCISGGSSASKASASIVPHQAPTRMLAIPLCPALCPLHFVCSIQRVSRDRMRGNLH